MKKNSKGFIVVATASVLLGTLTAGAVFVGYSLGHNSSNNLFEKITVKDKEVVYDGIPHKLDIDMPDQMKESHTIRNSKNEIVAECVKVDVYTYFIDFKYNDVVKKCAAKLTIIDGEDNNLNLLPSDLSLMSVKMARISADEYKISATITPSYYADTGVKWQIYWKNKDSDWAINKNVLDYLTLVDNKDLSCNIKRTKYFGEQMILKGISNYDNSMFATASIDCEKKLLSSELVLNQVISENYTEAISTKIATITHNTKISISNSNTYSDYTINKDYNPTYSFIFKDLSSKGEKLVGGQKVLGTYYFNKEYDLTNIYSKYIVNATVFNIDSFKKDFQSWYDGLSYDEKSANFIFKYSPFIDDEDTAHNGTDILSFYDIYSTFDSLTVNMNKYNIDSETKTLGIKILPIVSTSFSIDSTGIIF